MKIIYFVQNGKPTLEDRAYVGHKRSEQNTVHFSNGSVTYGFEDSCDAVYLSGDFPHIEKWAESKGIEVMKPEAAKVEPESDEAPLADEVKPAPAKRGRRKANPDNVV